MARFFGNNSGFLIRKDLKYFFYRIAVIAVPVGTLWVLMRYLSYEESLVLALLALAFVVFIAQAVTKAWGKKSMQFYRGRSGERDIREALKSLPDTFAVFEDIMLPGKKGNIDFIVVSPEGVYTLEVKSYGGHMEYSSAGLTVNGRPSRGRDGLKQAFGQAMALKSFLRQKLKQDVFVTPVLVFSNPYASANFGFQPVDNVYVVQKDLLVSLLMQTGRSLPVHPSAIEQALGGK